MTLVRYTLVLTLMLCASAAFSQNHATNIPPLAPPDITSATPDWALEMYSAAPNVHKVDQLFNEYYRTHDFEKTTDTRNYKHWRRYLNRYDMVQSDGSILVPTDAEMEARTQEWLALKATLDQQTAQRINAPNSVWEQIGPYENAGTGTTYTSQQSCQVAFAQCLGNLNVLYTVSQNGKVFKTIDHGETWSAIGENYFFSGDTWTEQCITVHPTDANTVYYGTGTKIWKSTDGGVTWTTMFTLAGLEPNAIIINQTSPETLLVSTEKGIYRSLNGGTTFTQVRAGISWDLRYKTNDPNTVFAICRNGTKSDFYKSTDGGTTWNASITGWFADPQDSDGGGRMTVSTGNPNLIYCFIIGRVTGDPALEKPIVGVAKSTDAGATWTLPVTWNNTKGINAGQGYYDLDIEVSDTDDNLLMIGTQATWRTTDGFTTVIGSVSGQHADPQEYHFNGPNDMWVASDGGMDLYNATLTTRSSKSKGITGTEFWGFDQGWNEDTRVGSYYHNGMSGYRQTYPENKFRNLGGGEPATGYISVGEPGKVWFSYPGGRYLPTSLTGTVTSFTYGKFPNESYWGQDVRSEITPHPLYFNTQFLGKDNVLWVTTDCGATFNALYTFGTNAASLVTSIEISRSNPQVMYVYQMIDNVGSWSSGKLWKTTDGGVTFAEVVQPASAPTSDGCFIAVDPLNPDNVWIAYNKTTTAYKVFKSTNGGATWTNLTTALLTNLIPRALIHIGGTDGGVYLMTPHTVFYRNNTHADWQAFGNGLPPKLENNYLRPFYKEGKIRMATVCRGMWSVDMYEAPVAPIAQPTVDKMTSDCHRDTFYFEDYSMLNHNGAGWSWNFFPAPLYVSSSSVRNPKVVFGTAGSFSVTLTVTDGNGVSSTKTVNNMVSLGGADACGLTAGPEFSLKNNGSGNYAKTIAPVPMGATNTITIMCWVKPGGIEAGNAGVAMTNAGNGGTGLNFRSNNQLGYHWNEEVGSYSWANGPTLPANVWSHVALVIEPTKATIYYNGVAYTRTATHVAIPFNSIFYLGNDRGTAARTMAGEMDEVRFYNRALTQNEIRDMRHLSYPGGDANCKAYYKFNEASGTIYDRVGLAHASLVGTATRVSGTAPVGAGTSSRLSVTTAGVKNFTAADAMLAFPATGVLPAGEMVVSKINAAPDTMPNCAAYTGGPTYWILDNYGTNQTFAALDSARFGNVFVPNTSDIPATSYALRNRVAANEHLNNWATNPGSSNAAQGGNAGWIRFGNTSNITTGGQFLVTNILSGQIISGPTQVCSGGNATLDAGAGFTTYAWSNGGGNAQTATFSNLTSNTTVTVTVTSASGCTGVAQKTISVAPAASTTVSGPSSVCTGGSATLDAGAGFAGYVWSEGGGSNQTATFSNLSITTTYTVTVTNTQGCTGTASKTVTVSSSTTTTISGPASICSGGSAILDAGAGFAAYAWSNGGGTAQTATFNNLTVTTTYTVTVSDAGGCTGTAQKTVTVNPPATTTISGTASVCVGGSATLDAGAGFTGYAWSNGGGNAQTAVFSNLTATTTFSVTITNALGCTGTAQKTVSVSASPNAAIAASAEGCVNGTSIASVAVVSGGTYNWSVTGGTIVSGQGTSAVNASWTTSGSKTFAVTVTNSTGCSATSTKSLTAYAGPTLSAVMYAAGCGGASGEVNLSPSAGLAPYTYTWTNSATTQDLVNVVAGTYSVTTTDARTCTKTGTYTVAGGTTPPAPATMAVVYVCGPLRGNVTWSGPQGGTYELRYRISSTATWTTVGNIGNVTAYTVSGLQGNKTYYFSVRYICPVSGASTWVQVSKKTPNCQVSSGVTERSEVPETGAGLPLQLMPNPASHLVKLVFDGAETGRGEVSLFNAEGQVSLHQSLEILAGENSIELDVSQLPEGVYHVVLRVGEKQKTNRLVLLRQ